tara:strand:- start:263 stop:847 length:585 start_codon:yes stop_codon:yes gene_type:complete
VFCRAIVKENERYKMEIKEIIKTGKAEAVNNALTDAADSGNLLVVKKLFKKRGGDIDINAVDSDGRTALFNSSYFGHFGITTFLLESKGIDVNKPETTQGVTPLSVASGQGHVTIVKLLLDAKGIEINQPENDGGTALGVASQKNQIEIVKLLLGAEGIEINQPANNGATALAMAKQEKNKEIVQLLIAAGATE